jgi:hypothetical protein
MLENFERRANEVMSVEDILKQILELFKNVNIRLEELQKQQSILDIQQQELLHYIENHKTNAIESCKLIKLLQQVRYQRRDVKNEADKIRSLKDTFIDKYQNKFIEKDIILSLKKLKEVENRQKNSTYQYQFLTRNLEFKGGTNE